MAAGTGRRRCVREVGAGEKEGREPNYLLALAQTRHAPAEPVELRLDGLGQVRVVHDRVHRQFRRELVVKVGRVDRARLERVKKQRRRRVSWAGRQSDKGGARGGRTTAGLNGG